MTDLDLTSDLLTLTRALCDVPSVSGDEGPLADLVERSRQKAYSYQI